VINCHALTYDLYWCRVEPLTPWCKELFAPLPDDTLSPIARADFTELCRIDYAKMRREMAPIRDELLHNRMHPSRLYHAEHDWLLF
jgi:hypothetical protein